MRQVSIFKIEADLETLEFHERLVTAFLVTPDGITDVSIEEEPVPAGLELLEVETRQRVTLESDPMRWAELLPGAYRSGDYRVGVDVADEEDMLIGAGVGDGDEEGGALLELA